MKKIIKRIAGVAMALVVGVSLVGCGSSSPDKVVDKNLKDLKTGLKSAAKELSEGKDSSLDKLPGLGAVASMYKGNAEAIKVLGTFADKMSEFDYTIGEVKKDGDTATVKVTIKAYDFANGVKAAAENAKEEAEKLAKEGKSTQEIQKAILVNVFKDMLSTAEKGGKSFSKDVEVKLTKASGEWKVDVMSVTDINNAILADMTKAVGELNK